MKYYFSKLLGVAALCAALMMIFCLSGSAALLGDVDGDKEVTSNDARDILRAAVHLEEFTDEKKLVADIDGDGNVSSSDARDALRISVGLDDERHLFTKEITKSPTCTEKGAYTLTCTECDELPVEVEIDALGHDLGEAEILVQVTCDADGKEKYSCSRCDYTEEKTVPAGHVPNIEKATCTEDQICTRGDHLMNAKTGHTTDWDKCKSCNVFITDRHAEAAALLKTKFTAAKAAFDYAYSINSYNTMLDGVSWKVLPNTEKAKPYYQQAKTYFEEALAICGDIPEFAAIKALIAKNIENITAALAQVEVILAVDYVDTRNFDTLVMPLEDVNDFNKDSTNNNNKSLTKLICW